MYLHKHFPEKIFLVACTRKLGVVGFRRVQLSGLGFQSFCVPEGLRIWWLRRRGQVYKGGSAWFRVRKCIDAWVQTIHEVLHAWRLAEHSNGVDPRDSNTPQSRNIP